MHRRDRRCWTQPAARASIYLASATTRTFILRARAACVLSTLRNSAHCSRRVPSRSLKGWSYRPRRRALSKRGSFRCTCCSPSAITTACSAPAAARPRAVNASCSALPTATGWTASPMLPRGERHGRSMLRASGSSWTRRAASSAGAASAPVSRSPLTTRWASCSAGREPWSAPMTRPTSANQVASNAAVACRFAPPAH